MAAGGQEQQGCKQRKIEGNSGFKGSRFRVQRFRVQGSKVQGSRFRVQGSGFRVQRLQQFNALCMAGGYSLFQSFFFD
jgi:hypothetical protein